MDAATGFILAGSALAAVLLVRAGLLRRRINQLLTAWRPVEVVFVTDPVGLEHRLDQLMAALIEAGVPDPGIGADFSTGEVRLTMRSIGDALSHQLHPGRIAPVPGTTRPPDQHQH